MTERSQDPPTGNLPVELSSFVGRDREQLDVRRLLAVAHTVTLTGPGGIGKSRLALHTARKLERHFADGVWLVELAELDSAELVTQAIVHALKVYERPGDAIEAALVDHLRERRLLLVLDNCEHLIEACRAVVSSIVSRCGGVRVLCTSRQRLGVPGEATVLVTPLDVPVTLDRPSTDTLAGADALRLLVDRAQARVPDFALTDENCGAAADLCRRLDGVPLAIELAAVRLASLTPADLLDRLDDRFRLLTAEREQLSRRHQTLRATVEWSHDLLSEEERVLWRRLSVFAGSFGIGAAEAVCAGGELDQDQILDLIGGLVDRSILVMMQRGSRGRYRLLETMRLYGAERLREAGETHELQRRHAAWCVEHLKDGDRPMWASAGRIDVLDDLDIDWANVEAALDFCAGSAIDAATGLRIATNLWIYWLTRGRYRMGRRHLEIFLAMAPPTDPSYAMALWASGWLAQATGDHDDALVRFEQARQVSEEAGAHDQLTYALMGLGVVRLRRGEVEEALGLLAASRETSLRIGDPVGRSFAIWPFAIVLSAAGQAAEALTLTEEALGAIAQFGDTVLRGVLDTVLGIAQWQLDAVEAAGRTLTEAVRLQDRLGHRWGLVTSVEGLAWVEASARRFERAARLQGAVGSLWQELGISPAPFWQVHRERCEAVVRAELGDSRYRACLEQGLALSRVEQVALALGAPVSAVEAPARKQDDGFTLSARELEVARLVADGLSNPAIAGTLFISVPTVKTHVSHILQKLTLDSRVQLAGWVANHVPAPAG
jgi:predicted ATPase/DNA-binding CsgD family transcriptional regulator